MTLESLFFDYTDLSFLVEKMTVAKSFGVIAVVKIP